MKTLIIIWTAVLISGIASVSYANAAVNHDLKVNQPFSVSDVKTPVNPQQTINGEVLQPAAHVQPNFTSTYNPQQTAPATELQ